MARRILYDKLQPHVLVPPVAFELIARLLTREPEKRLGSAPGDMDHFKRDTFFLDLNWDEVLKREVTPAFRPKSEETYIDPEAMQIPVGSDESGRKIGGSQGANSGSLPFNGFTYNKNQSPLEGGPAQAGALGVQGGQGNLKDSSYSSRSSNSPSLVAARRASHESGLEHLDQTPGGMAGEAAATRHPPPVGVHAGSFAGAH